MSRVLVTGATGLLGSSLVPLLAEDAEVIGVSRSGGGDPSLSTGSAAAPTTGMALDLADPTFPSRLPSGVDTVVHLAQSPRHRELPDSAPELFAVNTASTQHLLDWARRSGVSRFVVASSGAVHRSGAGIRHETDPTPPGLGFYAATKLAAEHLALAYADAMVVVILRYWFIYGPGQRSEMLVPRLIDTVRRGRAISLAGPDGMRFNPVHVADAARATAAATTLDTGVVVNVAGPEVLSLRDVGDAIGRAVGRSPSFTVDEGAAPPDLVASVERMEAKLVAPQRRFADEIGGLVGLESATAESR